MKKCEYYQETITFYSGLQVTSIQLGITRPPIISHFMASFLQNESCELVTPTTVIAHDGMGMMSFTVNAGGLEFNILVPYDICKIAIMDYCIDMI